MSHASASSSSPSSAYPKRLGASLRRWGVRHGAGLIVAAALHGGLLWGWKGQGSEAKLVTPAPVSAGGPLAVTLGGLDASSDVASAMDESLPAAAEMILPPEMVTSPFTVPVEMEAVVRAWRPGLVKIDGARMARELGGGGFGLGGGGGSGGEAGAAIGRNWESLLDGRALATRMPAPNYPERARRDGREGAVELYVAVTREGMAGKVMVLQTSGHRDLDSAACKVVEQQWRFQSSAAAGSRECRVRVSFRLRSGALASNSS